MTYKNLALLLLGILLMAVIPVTISCKKLNEATSLGSGLIPPVDNIHTFDTLIDVQAFNDTFDILTDTAYGSTSITNYIGQINNDPFFGKSDATLFLELKPPTFRFTFSNRPDSLHIDSVVLVLNYVETYGDTLLPQTVNVYEIDPISFFGDTSFPIRQSNYPKGNLLGSTTVIPATLKDSVKVYKDTTANQLRVRLSDAFGARLLAYDTTSANGAIPAYISDSAFRQAFKGFAVEAVGGNSLLGFNLGGTNTKLAIYYKNDKGGRPVTEWDTAVNYFTFNASNEDGAGYYVKRDYTGSALAATIDGTTTADDIVYIQNTPGSFARLKIPALAGLSNRIVHRAELVMEQLYDPSDLVFPAYNLYVDAYDATQTAYKTIPYSLLAGQSGFDLGSFGVVPFTDKDPLGNAIKVWRFDFTRYVQNVVNGNEPVYDFRVFAPYYVNELYQPSILIPGIQQQLILHNFFAKGRVRLHGGGDGSVPGANPQRMRMRIIYSKI